MNRHKASVTITIHYLSNEDIEIYKTYPAFKKLLLEPPFGDRSSASLHPSESSNLNDESTENPFNLPSTSNPYVYNVTSGPKKLILANQSAYSVIYETIPKSGDELSINIHKYQSTLVKIPGFEIYELRYEATANQFDRYFPIAKQIIDSFNFVR